MSTRFDVNASFPADARHAPVVRALAVQAAEFAGCAADVAQSFGEDAEATFARAVASDVAPVSIRIERDAAEIVAVISSGSGGRVARPAPSLG